jgi:heat shock protein HspQ
MPIYTNKDYPWYKVVIEESNREIPETLGMLLDTLGL